MASRYRMGSRRYMTLRIGLFFLAAGIWFAGVVTENQWITAVALVVGIGGLILGIVARKRDERAEVEESLDPDAAEQ